jgi:hypothetical protein
MEHALLSILAYVIMAGPDHAVNLIFALVSLPLLHKYVPVAEVHAYQTTDALASQASREANANIMFVMELVQTIQLYAMAMEHVLRPITVYALKITPPVIVRAILAAEFPELIHLCALVMENVQRLIHAHALLVISVAIVKTHLAMAYLLVIPAFVVVMEIAEDQITAVANQTGLDLSVNIQFATVTTVLIHSHAQDTVIA